MQPLINWLHASMQPSDEDLRRSVIARGACFSIACRVIYTTNYDDFIERTMALHGRSIVPICERARPEPAPSRNAGR